MSDERKNIIGKMNERESMEAFVEGAKKCVSAAYEMAKEFDDPEWASTAQMLEAIHTNGVKLSNMRAMSSFETAMAMNMKTGLIGQ